MIPRRARYLAQRFLDSILPLLEAHRDLDDRYADLVVEWREEYKLLTEIFKLALWTKVRLLLSTDLYRCVLPIPGTAYDRCIMKRGLDGHDDDHQSESGGAVSVTTFPCLLRYTAKKRSFNYNRFLTGKRSPKDLNPEILMSAIVLTKVE